MQHSGYANKAESRQDRTTGDQAKGLQVDCMDSEALKLCSKEGPLPDPRDLVMPIQPFGRILRSSCSSCHATFHHDIIADVHVHVMYCMRGLSSAHGFIWTPHVLLLKRDNDILCQIDGIEHGNCCVGALNTLGMHLLKC